MRNIEISEETYRRLFAFAESFEDGPEVVINRLLDQLDPSPGRASGRSRKSGPAAPGSILPESDYWVPILQIVAEEGGAAKATKVIDVLGRELAEQLKPADNQRLRTGETRWKNRARFARLRMKEQGLLSSTAGRGIWEITDEGRRFLTSREESADAATSGRQDTP